MGVGLVSAPSWRLPRAAAADAVQVVSVGCAVIGVLIGKYLEVAWAESDLLQLGILSSTTWDIFTDSESGVWSWFDLVWFAAAIFSAFRIPGSASRRLLPPPFRPRVGGVARRCARGARRHLRPVPTPERR